MGTRRRVLERLLPAGATNETEGLLRRNVVDRFSHVQAWGEERDIVTPSRHARP
jgi:hypothetical protein